MKLSKLYDQPVSAEQKIRGVSKDRATHGKKGCTALAPKMHVAAALEDKKKRYYRWGFVREMPPTSYNLVLGVNIHCAAFCDSFSSETSTIITTTIF